MTMATTMDAGLRDQAANMVVAMIRRVFGLALRGAILKGSALKGDFVPGYSDLDVHAFMDGSVMARVDLPKLEYVLAFQRAIGGVEPSDYGLGSFQIYFFTWDAYPAEWVKPIPGTYQVLVGDLPPGFTTVAPADYIRNAGPTLTEIARMATTLPGRFIDKPDDQIASLVRLVGIYLKPAAYCVLTLTTQDPFWAWRLPLAEATARATPLCSPSGGLRQFFAEIPAWPTRRVDPEWLREQFATAIIAMTELGDWLSAWQARGDGHAGDFGATGRR